MTGPLGQRNVVVFLSFQYIFGALRDCAPQLHLCGHEESTDNIIEAFDKETMATLKEVTNYLLSRFLWLSVLDYISVCVYYFFASNKSFLVLVPLASVMQCY